MNRAVSICLVLIVAARPQTTLAQSTTPKPTWNADSQTFTCPTGFTAVYTDPKTSTKSVSCENMSDWVATPVVQPARLAKAQSTPLAPRRKDIPSIAKVAKGAIVTIVTAVDDKPIALGTGFIVSPDGVIVTNYHVIKTGNVAATKFADGSILEVDGVLAADKDRDLAIIKIHGKVFHALTLGNSDQIQIGEDVVAIGNPLGLELTVSNGILSGIRADKDAGGKFLQTTAPISHGSSGGPLFNMQGQVIGINSMYYEGGENLNFAIPINDAKRLLSAKSTELQNLPNEAEPRKVLPTKSETIPQPDQSIDSPAYRQYQELLRANDLTMRAGLYACFYDRKERATKFFVISANLMSKHSMQTSVNSFTDGVMEDHPLLFSGGTQSYSSKLGIFADLLTMHTKNGIEKSHDTDVLKWIGGDFTIEAGYGPLLPGQARMGYRFGFQHSTGRFVEDVLFNTGVEPEGFTTHDTGKCVRIPNVVMTPEEQFEVVGN
jgi:S1-C subfamily serine protease